MHGVIYRPPSSLPAVLSNLQSSVEELPPNKQKSLVLQVFSTQPTSPIATPHSNNEDKLDLHQGVSETPRSRLYNYSNKSETIIDHAYV